MELAQSCVNHDDGTRTANRRRGEKRMVVANSGPRQSGDGSEWSMLEAGISGQQGTG